MANSNRWTDRPHDGDRRTSGHLLVGRSGEDLAAKWYEARGFEVLARNWRCREGELDIVARRARLVVFCEVKARTSDTFGAPAEAVGPSKQAKVRRLAALWFAAQARSKEAARHGGPLRSEPMGGGPMRGGPVRFDVASVLAGEVQVIEGAF
jgi:putative endonuclease